MARASVPMKTPPTYGATSVDHALRLAVVLQVEGPLTVSAAADRLGVARSTAHRLLQALVYRDFAVQDEDRAYRAGPILELSSRSPSDVARLRAAASEPMRVLVDTLGETCNLSVRIGTTIRFIASVECDQALRVGSREGMVFPAHMVTGGLVLLAALSPERVDALYGADRFADRPDEMPDLRRLHADLRAVRRTGIALNLGRSERGLAAVGRAVLDADGDAVAAVSVSMPTVRYRKERMPDLVAALGVAADAVTDGL
ncbi:IclR family transcriptional regulator [Kineosporia sp. R_H_3]|uniref:IclR family transcriptional regulator n=1 Tax=Kineosporia sp. R_H_3 TaxID=1961848 RepID=UPI0018E96D6A|nr:IclR family transcriptional regulator [Kineosporia sp. R_H_3]